MVKWDWGLLREGRRPSIEGPGLTVAQCVNAGYYACNKNTQVGRPTSIEELLALIKGFELVRGSGSGPQLV